MISQALLIFATLASASTPADAQNNLKQTIELAVTEKGFEPKSIDVKSGTEVTLKVTRKTDATCAKQIQVPTKNLKVDLPLDKPVTLALGSLAKGDIRFGCGMDMMETGVISVK